MAEATFVKGNPETVDYTPAAGDLAAGQVVPLANAASGFASGIAAVPITNGVLGALTYGGEWNVTAAGNYAQWARVWWDDAVNKVSTTSTNSAMFGFITDRGGVSANTQNATVRVKHFPFVW